MTEKSSKKTKICARSIDLSDEIRAAFPGSWYSLADIKSKLMEIYDQHGIQRTAKATDIKRFFPGAINKKNATENGRTNGYQLRINPDA